MINRTKKNAMNRIISDLQDIKQSKLAEEYGIHYEFNDRNIFHIRFLIIGPPETPYENGFFFFDVNFPDDYPFSPPTLKYRTNGNKIRFNPNLYRNGKVCLSILNTWDGPGWSPCNTISTVMLSILGLVLTKDPIRNEPGFSDCKEFTSQVYNAIIQHETMNIGVINMLSNPPYGFKYFKDIMVKHLIKKRDWYIKKCISLHETYQNKSLKFSLYNMDVKCRYDIILHKISTLINEHEIRNVTKRVYRKKRKMDTESDYSSGNNSDNDINMSDSSNNDDIMDDLSSSSSFICSDSDTHMTDNEDIKENEMNIKQKNVKKCIGYLKNGKKCSFKAQIADNYCKFHMNQKIII